MENLIKKLQLLLEDGDLSAEEKQLVHEFTLECSHDTFLKLISKNHVVEKTDGICSHDELQKTFVKIDWTMDYFGDEDDDPTDETKFDRYAVVKKARPMDMFTEVLPTVSNPDDLFFTKAQIKSIVQNNREMFHKINHA